MCDERKPYLGFDTVFCFRIKVMELEVLLKLFEQQIDVPPKFIKKGDFFPSYFKVVSYELLHPPFVAAVGYFS